MIRIVLLVVTTISFIFSQWNQTAKLKSSTVIMNASFGGVNKEGVDIHGDYAIVSAGYENNATGAVYIFQRSGQAWNQIAKILPDAIGSGDVFGRSVAIYNVGETVYAASSTIDYQGKGAVFIYKKSSGSNNFVLDDKIIYASDRTSNSLFGESIDFDYYELNGQGYYTLVVGATQDLAENQGGQQEGSVYVFSYYSSGWSQTAKFKGSDKASMDQFGRSVAISGRHIVVGAPGKDVGGYQDVGMAYVFYLDDNNQWSEQQILGKDDTQDIKNYGRNVAIDGETIVIGAPESNLNSLNDVGSIYIFTKTGSGNSPWSKTQNITPSDGSSSDYFGSSVSISGNRIIVGSPHDDDNGNTSGSAYMYIKSSNQWVLEKKIKPSDGDAEDYFGMSVSIHDNYSIVAATHDDDDKSDSGAAYIFTGPGMTENSSFEYNAYYSIHPSIVKVSAYKYAIAYYGVANDAGADDGGHINLIEISNNGSTFNQRYTYYHNDNDGRWNSLIKASGSTDTNPNVFLLGYMGSNTNAEVKTFDISANSNTITQLESQYTDNYNFGSSGLYSSAVQINDYHYAVAYSRGVQQDGKITTVNYSSSNIGKSISSDATLHHETGRSGYHSFIKISDSTFVLAYEGEDSDGYLKTFIISNDGKSITQKIALEHDASHGLHNSLIHLYDNIYVLAYSGVDNDGFISTFTIPKDGSSITKIATFEHDENDNYDNSLIRVDQKTVALAYRGKDNDGYVKVFEVSNNGSTINELSSNEHETDQAYWNSFIKSDANNYVLAYTGEGNDGYIKTFNFTPSDAVPPSISSVSLASDNSTIDVTFDEEVFSTPQSMGEIEVSDFVFSLSGGRATLASNTPAFISISGNTFKLGISLDKSPNGNETLTVLPTDDAIYDIAGNEASQSQSNNSVSLNADSSPPVISSLVLSSDNKSVTVNFNENIYKTNGGVGSIEKSAFSLSMTGGSANLKSSTPTSISGSGKTYTLSFELDKYANGNEILKVDVVDDAIYDEIGNEASTNQSNNTIKLFPPILFTVKKDGSGNFSTIQSAIDSVKSSDSLIVYPGTYEEDVNFKNKNIILGSLYVLNGDSTYRDQTIIKGDVVLDTIASDGGIIGMMIYKHDLKINGGRPQLKLLHIRERQGPGLSILNNANVVLDQSIISANNNNQDSGNLNKHGGGINISKSKVVINNTRIDSNYANDKRGYYGGGIYSANSYIEINNTRISNNIADKGGGIYSTNDSSLILTNVVFDNDSSNNQGGAMNVNFLKKMGYLTNISFLNNIARYSGRGGGGLFIDASKLKIKNSLFKNNKSNKDSGGALYLYTSGGTDSLLVSDTKFLNNFSQDNGGGVYVYSNTSSNSKIEFSNTLFDGNIAKNGKNTYTSAFYSNSRNPGNVISIKYSTFVNNVGGYAVRMLGPSEFINSISWNNRTISYIASNGDTSFHNTSIYDIDLISHSLARNISNENNNINADPRFINNSNNYNLSEYSPAIGAAKNLVSSYSNYSKDIDGNSRPNPTGSFADIGAYESSFSKRKINKLYVQNISSSSENGNLSNPYKSIQNAIDNSYNLDTIIVHPGKYIGDISFNNKNVKLFSKVIETNNLIYRDSTIINGNVAITNIDSSSMFSGFMVYKGQVKIHNSLLKIKDLHIRDHNTTGLSIRNNSNVKLDNLKIANNNSDISGGGISLYDSKVDLINSVIDSNSSTNAGGGIISGRSYLKITNSKITNNFARNYGAGIHSSYDSSLFVFKSTFENDSTSSNNGGAIYIDNPLTSVQIDQSTFNSNVSSKSGGAIYVLRGGVNINNSSFMNNLSAEDGGVLYIELPQNNVLTKDSLIISNSTIKNNKSYREGTFLYANLRGGDFFSLTKSTIVSNENLNQSNNYRLIRIIESSTSNNFVIDNNTISNNNIYSIFSLNQRGMKFSNNIIWHNKWGDDLSYTSFADNSLSGDRFSYNNIEGYQNTADGNINSDPLFTNISEDNYVLKTGSPSIDTGHPDLDGDGETWETDEDDQDDDGTRLDMGSAFFNQIENIPPTISLNNFNNDNKIGSGSIKQLSWSSADNFRISKTKLFIKYPDSSSFTLLDSLKGNPQTYNLNTPLKISKDYYLSVTVFDPSNNTASDTLQFEIFDVTKPVVSILNPTSSFQISEYDTLKLQWNLSDNHKLDSTWVQYTLDDFSSYVNVDSFGYDSLNYNFIIPKGMSETAKIKIIASDSTGNKGDAITASFSILDNTPPTISIADLPSQNKFGSGSTQTIDLSIDDNGSIEQTLIYLKYPNQKNFNLIDTFNEKINSYSLIVPLEISKDVLFKAMVIDAVGLASADSQAFEIYDSTPPTITITDPKSTDAFKEGELVTINFNISDNHKIDSTFFYYSIDDFQTEILMDSVSNVINSRKLILPKGVTEIAQFKIFVTDSTGNKGNQRSPKFEVIDNTRPNVSFINQDGQTYKIGTVEKLEWKAVDNVGVEYANVDYSKNGTDWIGIATDITSNFYNWTVANDPFQNAKIRIIVFDKVSLSDTSTISNILIKESYPQIISNSLDEKIDYKTKEIKLFFDQSMDKTSLSSSQFSISSKALDYQVPAFSYDDLTKSITLTFEQGFYSHDSITLDVSGDLKSIYGYQFDGDRTETPGGKYLKTFTTSLIGDYNNDTNIDVIDLVALINALESKDTNYDIGPTVGSTVPYLKTISDDKIDIEDVMAFVRIWNWFQSNSNTSIDYIASGYEPNIEFSHNMIEFPFDSSIGFYEIEISYINDDFKIDHLNLPNSLLKHFNPETRKLKLVSDIETSKIIVPFSFNERWTDVVIDYRYLDTRGIIKDQGSISKSIENIPNQFSLNQNYPNPFNPSTTINFSTPTEGDVSINIYNVLGQLVRSEKYTNLKAGYHSYKWNALNDEGAQLSAGIYIYQLRAENYILHKRMLYLK